jgi:OPA family glycerol-3-phosphate transporter-like MFS transporter
VTPWKPRLLVWQIATVGLMVVGYSGYYLCRSNFSATLPLIVADLQGLGYDAAEAKIHLGSIASAGVFAYALGKFLSGGLADFLGGRRMYLGGMFGAVVCTLAFAIGSSVPVFLIAWVANRLVQSLGWVGMVKVTSRWFPFGAYGTVMGVISLSYLFGDAAARWFIGRLIEGGFGWQAVFVTAAGVLFVVFVVNALLLRESPGQVGAPEPATNPANLFGARGQASKPPNLAALLVPLARSPVFWTACVLSLSYTLMRETFNTWTATYFTDVVGLTAGEAADRSALFPLFGGVSVLLAGLLSDLLGRGGRALILFVGLVATGGLLLVLAYGDFGGVQWRPVAVVTLLGFVMLGPYSYLAGAVALDFGGKQASATACGVIDGVGYLGGVLAGDSMARLSVYYSWPQAFAVLAALAFLSSPAGLLYLVLQTRALARRRPPVERDDADGRRL